MGYLDQALGIAGALGRAYSGYSTGQVQKPPNGGGPLMKYLHGRQYGKQPNGTSQADGGLPDGAMPPPGPTPPVGAPPSMPMPPQPQSQPVPMSPPAIPTPSISPQAQPTPPTNPYQNPYPLQPPPTDQEDPNAVVPGSTQGQRFAQGTVVSQPTNAIIGEDGPEMVVPLSGRPDAKVSPRNLPQMTPTPTPRDLAGMNQQQLAELSKRNPQLVSQFLLMQQGLRTNTSAPPGAPPRFDGAYLFNSRQDYQSPTGHPMGSMNRADDDAVRVDEMISSHGQTEPNVISEMGNALGKKMSDQASDNQSRAGLADFYRKQKPQMQYGRR